MVGSITSGVPLGTGVCCGNVGESQADNKTLATSTPINTARTERFDEYMMKSK